MIIFLTQHLHHLPSDNMVFISAFLSQMATCPFVNLICINSCEAWLLHEARTYVDWWSFLVLPLATSVN